MPAIMSAPTIPTSSLVSGASCFPGCTESRDLPEVLHHPRVPRRDPQHSAPVGDSGAGLPVGAHVLVL